MLIPASVRAHISCQHPLRIREAHSDHQYVDWWFEDDPAKLEDFIDTVSVYMRLFFAVSWLFFVVSFDTPLLWHGLRTLAS
jgi:hypothetical protein